MKYIGYIKVFTAALVLLFLACACTTQEQPPEYGTTNTQVGTQYQSSWITGISKASATANAAVADWVELCSSSERDGIGHYVLRNSVDNGDGTTTHHLLIYRSATEYDAASFTVDFAAEGETLTVTPTYTSSDKSQYGYDLIYLTLRAESDMRIAVELLVDGDYPGQIVTTTKDTITPDTFGAQSNE